MCAHFFEGLFGGKPKQAPAPQPVATAATREKRNSGQVKSESEDLSTEGTVSRKGTNKVAGGGNSSIGIAIGTPESPRKRTTELGL